MAGWAAPHSRCGPQAACWRGRERCWPPRVSGGGWAASAADAHFLCATRLACGARAAGTGGQWPESSSAGCQAQTAYGCLPSLPISGPLLIRSNLLTLPPAAGSWPCASSQVGWQEPGGSCCPAIACPAAVCPYCPAPGSAARTGGLRAVALLLPGCLPRPTCPHPCCHAFLPVYRSQPEVGVPPPGCHGEALPLLVGRLRKGWAGGPCV